MLPILAIPQLSTCMLFHLNYIIGSSQRAWIYAGLKTYNSLTVLNSSIEARALGTSAAALDGFTAGT
jgi:hypothetical protein